MSESSLTRSDGAKAFEVEVGFDAEAVQAQWEELESQGTAFQSRAWLIPWFRIIAPRFRAKPVYVTVREKATRRPVMFLPLCLRRRHGLKTIEFPDLEVSDYNAPLMSPDFDPSDSELQDLWADIRRALPRADLVRLEKVPTALFGRDNPLARLEWTVPSEVSAWIVELPATKSEYDERLLNKKTRKENRRKRKNLGERIGDFALAHAATPSEGEAIFAALRDERRARFGSANLLDQPSFLAFYRAVIFDEWRPFAMLSALKAGDRILATLFAVRWRDAYLLLMHSFAPELEGLSPGIVAMDEMIAERIAAGDKYFDFTVGGEGYKRQFGVQETLLVDGYDPLSALGRVYVFAFPYAKRGKAALKTLLKHVRDPLSHVRRATRGAPLASEAS